LSITKQRAVGLIPAWSLAFLHQALLFVGYLDAMEVGSFPEKRNGESGDLYVRPHFNIEKFPYSFCPLFAINCPWVQLQVTVIVSIN